MAKAVTQTRRLLPVMPPLVFDVDRRVRLLTPTKTVELDGSVRSMVPDLSMENRASTLTVTVHDPDGKLWRDAAIRQPMALSLPDSAPRYVQEWRIWRSRGVGAVSRQGGDVVLTFWDAGSAALKLQTKPISRSASNMNLQGWVELLAGEVADYYPLQVVVPRPNSAPPREADADGREATSAGFSTDNKSKVTVKGRPASSEQLKAIDRVLSTCVKEKAGARAVWATVTANIGESEYKVDALNPSSQAKGIYQLLPSTASSFNLDPLDVEACTSQFLNHGYTAGKTGGRGAKYYARNNPGMTPGEIASKVEGSDRGGSFYQAYAPEARTIIELWGGVTLDQWSIVSGASDSFSAGDGSDEDARPTQWRRGRPEEPESSLKCLGRIADGLGRRAFVSASRIVVPRDQDLILAAPHLSMQLIDDEILVSRPTITPHETISLTVHASQWSAPPGAVVEIIDSGPIERYWLVTYVRGGQPGTLEVQLQQPTTKIPSGNGSRTDSDRASGTTAAAAIKWAESKLGVREIGNNAGREVSEIITDNGGTTGQPWCGYFCRGALRAAGLHPPVSMASVQWIYDASQRGEAPFSGATTAKNAKPGDLAVLYGSGTHVGLIVRVDVAGGKIYTIEGNTSTPDFKQGVARKTHSFSDVVRVAKVDYSKSDGNRVTGNTPTGDSTSGRTAGGTPYLRRPE